MTCGQQLGHSCSQVSCKGPHADADMEQMLDLMSPQALLSMMEQSFEKITELLRAPNNRDWQSPEVVEDSLSLIIDDLALGRHTL